VTIYRNRPIYGYVSCLTTNTMWQRIVSLVRTRVTAIPDWFRDRFSTSADVPVSGGAVCRKIREWGV